jgi:transcriptional regulator with GAF, ATPase, and Fis domain
VQQILDAMLLSEQRKQLDTIAKEPLAVDTRSNNNMTPAEMKHLERENSIAALQATTYRIYVVGSAAELLGVKATTLTSRVKALGIRLRPNAQTLLQGRCFPDSSIRQMLSKSVTVLVVE